MAKKVSQTRGRVRKLTKKQTKNKLRKDIASSSSLPSGLVLARRAVEFILRSLQPLLAIAGIYLVLNIVFASGLSNISGNFTDVTNNLKDNSIWSAASGLGSLIVSSSPGSASGSTMQSVLFVIMSLVVIYSIRQLMSGKKLVLKQAFYGSTAPLVPFVLVLAVFLIQLAPVIIGGLVLGAVLFGVFSVNGLTSLIYLILISGLFYWTLKMISSTIFALYIVTLPNTTPRQALASARNIVSFKRLLVLRKIGFLAFSIAAVFFVVLVPLIILLPSVVPFTLLMLGILSVLYGHIYLYGLYKELLA